MLQYVDPVDLSLGNMRNIGAKWLVEKSKYITDNCQFIVNVSFMLEFAELLMDKLQMMN